MINKILKNKKRISYFYLLIAIFSIIVIIACGGTDITGDGRDDSDFTQIPQAPDPEKTGPLNSDLNSWDLEYTVKLPDIEIPTPTFPNDSYYEIYAPFVTTTTNYLKVSYLDTASLNSFWKRHVNRAASNDNLRWIIRDGDNRQTDPRNGNYYYFDKNADIVHVGNYANKVKVKEFVGGVIVKYNRDWKGNISGVWTIGGLYRTLLNKDRNNSKGQQGYAKYNNYNLNEFMRAIDNREEGDLSVILMNAGYSSRDKRYTFDFNWSFGVDEYYCTIDNNYRKNPSYFLGKNPTNYLGTDEKGYKNEKLNIRINYTSTTVSGDSGKFNYRFILAETLNWWLQ